MEDNSIKINRKDVKVRKTWNIDPSTKIEKVKKDYSRTDNKKAIQDALDELDDDLNWYL